MSSTNTIKQGLTLQIAKDIINTIKTKYFDSHVFILKLKNDYPNYYDSILASHKGKINTADGEIAKFLSDNSVQLGIVQINGKILSINILGKPSENALWEH